MKGLIALLCIAFASTAMGQSAGVEIGGGGTSVGSSDDTQVLFNNSDTVDGISTFTVDLSGNVTATSFTSPTDDGNNAIEGFNNPSGYTGGSPSALDLLLVVDDTLLDNQWFVRDSTGFMGQIPRVESITLDGTIALTRAVPFYNVSGVALAAVDAALGHFYGDQVLLVEAGEGVVSRFTGNGGTAVDGRFNIKMQQGSSNVTRVIHTGSLPRVYHAAGLAAAAGVCFDDATGGNNSEGVRMCFTPPAGGYTADFDLVVPDVANDSVFVMDTSSLMRSHYWGAQQMSADGVQCADPAEVTINSGPKTYTVICADNDASTLHGSLVMPDGWNGGVMTFELAYIQTAVDTAALESDISAQCRGPGETVDNTFSAERAIDDAAVTGSNGIDYTTSTAFTPDGTCAAGDIVFWKWQLDAAGTTTAAATLHIVGMKMEYTAVVSD